MSNPYERLDDFALETLLDLTVAAVQKFDSILKKERALLRLVRYEKARRQLAATNREQGQTLVGEFYD